MKELSLRERLLNYMKKNHTSWVSSGELQRLTVLHTIHTPRSAVRRLQELHEEGFLRREIRKKHTWYQFAHKTPTDAPQTIPEINPSESSYRQECKQKVLFFDHYQPNTVQV